MIHNQPYAKLAKIYDRVMSHVKYDEWAEYISSIFQYFGIKVSSILELACGTGTFSTFLHSYGYNITGMDISPAMLGMAADKFKEKGMPLRLFAADMTSLPLKTEFDAVLCLYDSINYLRQPAVLRKTIEEISTVTKSGGFFIFDVCTIKNSKKYFSNNSMFEDMGNVKYKRNCRFHYSNNIQENLFIIEYNGERFEEKHLQRIYSIDEVRRIISGTPFKTRGIFDDLTFNPGTENSGRIHFVLQRM